MMLTAVCPVFPCADLDRTAAFYTRLGFAETGRWGDSYLTMEKDAAELHFAGSPGHRPRDANVAVFIRAQDVDGWSDRVAALNLSREAPDFPRFAPAQDRDWGVREMHVLDPDGHLLRVGQDNN